MKKNFVTFESTPISGRQHVRIKREDDGFEFYMDDFFLELAETMCSTDKDFNSLFANWPVEQAELEFALDFLKKERLVIPDENC